MVPSIARSSARWCAAALVLVLAACGGAGLSGDYGGENCFPYQKLSFQGGGVVYLTAALVGGEMRGTFKVDGEKVSVQPDGGASMVYTRKGDDLTTSVPLLGEAVCTKTGSTSSGGSTSSNSGPSKASSAFCADWAKTDAATKKFEADAAAMDARNAEPTVANMQAVFKPYLDGTKANIAALEKSAPSELKAAIANEKKAVEGLSARIEKAGYDFSKIDESELTQLEGAAEASGKKLNDWVAANCK